MSLRSESHPGIQGSGGPAGPPMFSASTSMGPMTSRCMKVGSNDSRIGAGKGPSPLSRYHFSTPQHEKSEHESQHRVRKTLKPNTSSAKAFTSEAENGDAPHFGIGVPETGFEYFRSACNPASRFPSEDNSAHSHKRHPQNFALQTPKPIFEPCTMCGRAMRDMILDMHKVLALRLDKRL